MKKITIALISLFFIGHAKAYDIGLAVGLKTTDVKSKASGVSASGGSGLNIGVVGTTQVADQVFIRSGAMYAQRKFSVKTSGASSDTDISINYLDVPVTAMFNINDNFGLFGGLLLGLKISDDCDSGSTSCTLDEVNSLIYGLDFGAQFKFIPNMGVELAYTMGLSNVWGNDSDAGVEKASGLTANFVYFF